MTSGLEMQQALFLQHRRLSTHKASATATFSDTSLYWTKKETKRCTDWQTATCNETYYGSLGS